MNKYYYELELARESQRRRGHPLYLYRKFDDWTNRTGILNGSGLTWVGRIPAGIIATLTSLIYWFFVTRKEDASCRT